MELLEWQNSARGDVTGIEFTAAGPVVKIDAVKHLLREPKIRELRQIDEMFWKITDAEQAASNFTADTTTSPEEQAAAVMAQRRRVYEFRSAGGFGPVWALTVNLLAGTDIAAEDMPAWSATGDVLFELITAWWNTPLARGPQSPLE